MAVSYIGKGAFASGTGALTVGVPTGYANDDIFILMVNSANQAVTTPSGWTQVTNSPQGTGTAGAIGAVLIAVFWKLVSGTQSSVSVADTGSYTTAIISCWRGCNTTTPFNTTAGSVNATATSSLSCPTVTTTLNGCMIVNAIGLDADVASTAHLSSWANSSLVSITEGHDQTVTSGVGGGIGYAYGIKTASGSVSASTVTGATSTTHAYLTMALAPLVEAKTVALSALTAVTDVSDAGQKNGKRAIGDMSATFGGSVTGESPNKSKALDPLTGVTGASVAGRKNGARAIGALSATGNLASGVKTNRASALSALTGVTDIADVGKKGGKKAVDPLTAVTGIADVGKKGGLRALGSLSATGGFTLAVGAQKSQAIGVLSGTVGFTSVATKRSTQAVPNINAVTGIDGAWKKSAFIVVSLTGAGDGFIQFTTQRKVALGSVSNATGLNVVGSKQGGDARYGSFDFAGATTAINATFVVRRIGSFSLPSSTSIQAVGRKNGRGVSVIVSEANLSLNALKRAVQGLTLSTIAGISTQAKAGLTGSFALSGGTVILYVSNVVVVPIIQRIPVGVLVAGMNPMQLMAGKQLLTIVVPNPKQMELVAGKSEMQMVIVDPMNIGEI